MQYTRQNTVLTAEIHDLIREDVAGACDDADLRCRLARNGYGFRDTLRGRMLVTLPHQVEVCPLA